jgi:hypothetical protein
MKDLIRTILREAIFNPENELFSAYNGRYIFNVDRAYTLIKNKGVKSQIKSYNPAFLSQFSHPEFSAVDSVKLDKLKGSLDLKKPLGILVNFMNPDDGKTEWILIDGNHRVRAAAENDMNGLLYVIQDPNDVNKFMKTDSTKPHQLFPDEDF